MKLEKLDPILIMLFVGIFLMTGVLVFVEHFFVNDGQIFQVISGLATSFAGAFFMRINPKPAHQTDVQTTNTNMTTKVEGPVA